MHTLRMAYRVNPEWGGGGGGGSGTLLLGGGGGGGGGGGRMAYACYQFF